MASAPGNVESNIVQPVHRRKLRGSSHYVYTDRQQSEEAQKTLTSELTGQTRWFPSVKSFVLSDNSSASRPQFKILEIKE